MDGISWAVANNPNYSIHFSLSIIAVIAGFYFHIVSFEWLILILTIGLGLVVETINSALESTTDAITREFRPEIKIAKDVAAGAMLIYALTALIVAAAIFGPYLI